MPDLTTTRLVLRPLSSDDAEMLFPIFGDPIAMHYWDFPVRRTVEQTAEMLRSHFASGPYQGTWCLTFKGERFPVGMVQYHRREPCHRRAAIRYILARRHWRQGLMSEAVPALLCYCFETLVLHRVEAAIEPDNINALQLLERLSFRKEGLLRGRDFVEPSYRDVFIYALLDSEWRTSAEPIAELAATTNVVKFSATRRPSCASKGYAWPGAPALPDA
ncbi:GNAT family protein [Methylocystis sp. 9N]|uniref:GNAT family protein n=1 Tax=Methylocystis borbori TaxID=3118750 RepID=A0ABU7XE69_9HYPH